MLFEQHNNAAFTLSGTVLEYRTHWALMRTRPCIVEVAQLHYNLFQKPKKKFTLADKGL